MSPLKTNILGKSKSSILPWKVRAETLIASSISTTKLLKVHDKYKGEFKSQKNYEDLMRKIVQYKVEANPKSRELRNVISNIPADADSFGIELNSKGELEIMGKDRFNSATAIPKEQFKINRELAKRQQAEMMGIDLGRNVEQGAVQVEKMATPELEMKLDANNKALKSLVYLRLESQPIREAVLREKIKGLDKNTYFQELNFEARDKQLKGAQSIKAFGDFMTLVDKEIAQSSPQEYLSPREKFKINREVAKNQQAEMMGLGIYQEPAPKLAIRSLGDFISLKERQIENDKIREKN